MNPPHGGARNKHEWGGSLCLLQMIQYIAFYDMQVHSPRILKSAPRDRAKVFRAKVYNIIAQEMPIICRLISMPEEKNTIY